MAKKEELWYVVPEIEVRVHESWTNLIEYCKENLPYGDIKIQISNAQPTKRIKETPKIRFDKITPGKVEGNWYLIPSLGLHVHECWVNLVQWCQNYFCKGELELRIVNGQPVELLSSSQDIRFNKKDTIPAGTPLNFTK